MIAIILAGGEGTRLRPLTYKIPKALIPVQDKTLTEHVIDIYKKFNVKDFYLSTSYMADKVEEYFKDGSKFGINIKYLEEKERMGTAGPLILLKNQNEIPEEDFFMCNGDNLFNLDLEEMKRIHKKNNSVATIALTKVDDPTHFGIARLEEDKILEFVEKPTKESAPSNYASSGYYLLSPKVFDYLPNKDFVMTEIDIWPQLAKKGLLSAYRCDGQWFDTGTPECHEQVNREWKGVG